MTFIQPSLNLAPSPGKDRVDDPLWKRLRQVYEKLAVVINGTIEYGNPISGPANIRGVWASPVTPAAPNTDFIITHNLGRPAVGVHLMTKNAACDVYTSPTANPNPNTQIILRATAGTVALTLFLL